ncbi:AraC family transcriptional regulator [Cohnella endophytica]|uniref:AraC family transcriptional regulator n=1 Tax=Cohnella endophytica TaxID=2419778 RepID=A0A494XRC8_9BACL|nr:AraC family transcriptional regulator [Cohnella endophytica]RKP53168.1 AraC family transcriptional regulator [Cohnella endophytica]
MDNGKTEYSSWILPIRISVRRWSIPLPEHERNLLEYALCNATDELIRHPLSGATVRIRHGAAVFLFGLPAQNQILSGVEHRCRQLRKFAKASLYADVDIDIGETVPMKELALDNRNEPENKQPQSNDFGRLLHMRQDRHSDDAIIRQVFDYIEENLLDQLSREKIADFVHFHPAYLSRFFRKKTGLSLSEYIVQQRIERAKVMLTQSELRIGHIMNNLGYDNLSHFTRTFKKMTGYTPLQYRKIIR